MRANLDTQDELDLFRDIRKDLTHFLIAGSKTINMIRKFDAGNTHYMLPVNGHVVPNRLDSNYILSIHEKLNQVTTNLNADIFNKTLLRCQQTINIASDIHEEYSTKLVAKAWRAVRRSHTDFRTYTFTSNLSLQQQQERHDNTETTTQTTSYITI